MQTYSFGDVRLDRRADIVTEQIVATGSLVPRRFGGGRKGELAAGTATIRSRAPRKTMATGGCPLAAMIAGFVIAMPDLAAHGADV